jgi:hypothetical protein
MSAADVQIAEYWVLWLTGRLDMNPRFTCAMRPDTSLNLMRYGS